LVLLPILQNSCSHNSNSIFSAKTHLSPGNMLPTLCKYIRIFHQDMEKKRMYSCIHHQDELGSANKIYNCNYFLRPKTRETILTRELQIKTLTRQSIFVSDHWPIWQRIEINSIIASSNCYVKKYIYIFTNLPFVISELHQCNYIINEVISAF
jgi:hypothetical protein